MAKTKKRVSRGKRRPARGAVSRPRPVVRDRRALEKQIWEMSRVLAERDFATPEEANAFVQDAISKRESFNSAKLTPLDQAQDLMYTAFDSAGKRRVALARRALEISPDCADAYTLLAEEQAETLQDARSLFEKAVAAGERSLPAGVWDEAGSFWAIVETRPYMRARCGLAQVLWALSEADRAIEHYRELLRLNPNDNQGARFDYINCLMLRGRDDEAAAVLDRYKSEISAAWLFSRALCLFRREGKGRKASAALAKAFDANPHVLAYLLDLEDMPRRIPEAYQFGDENEAALYVLDASRLWDETEGALEWAAMWMIRAFRRRPTAVAEGDLDDPALAELHGPPRQTPKPRKKAVSSVHLEAVKIMRRIPGA